MSDDEMVSVRLAGEIQRLMVDPRVPAALTFSAPPFEASVLVAALQGTSRNPGLSDVQRAIVVDFAGQIADGLIRLARGAIGPGSAIETTLMMGFDPSFDEPREGR